MADHQEIISSEKWECQRGLKQGRKHWKMYAKMYGYSMLRHWRKVELMTHHALLQPMDSAKPCLITIIVAGTVVLRHFEPKCLIGRGQFGLVVDKRPATLEKMRDYGHRFGIIASHFAATGQLPLQNRLWQRWFELLYRMGNRIMYPIGAKQ